MGKNIYDSFEMLNESFQSLLCFVCDVDYRVFMAVAMRFDEETVESFKSCPFKKDLLRCLDIRAVCDCAYNFSFLGAPTGIPVSSR